MPRMGKNTAGRSKASGRNTSGQGTQIKLGRKASKPRGRQDLGDDQPLDPNVDYEEQAEEAVTMTTSRLVEPFTDGIVSLRLRGLTVVPRAGGEEAAVLHDFLLLFAKTETSMANISNKTSFMKKAGGRLL